jgi:hypothetical protein
MSLAKLRYWFLLTTGLKKTMTKAQWRWLLTCSVQTVCDSYLQGMFNIQPFLSDLKNIRDSFRNVPKQIENLLKGEGKIQKHHYRVFLNSAYSNSSESYEYTAASVYADGKKTCSRSVRYVDPVFNATLTYAYRLSSLDRENALYKGMADSLGVMLDPGIIWRAVPWSFVVDWFVGIGPWLSKNFSMPNIAPVTHIYSYVYSIKVQRAVNTTYSATGSPYGPSCYNVPICSTFEEAYKRVPHCPDIYYSLRMSGLSLTEFSLSAALLGVRV